MMACKTSFELYHNFPKLAEETGFTFNTHRPRVHIEWNKIKLIDIESLIRERKFVLIEQHVNDILDCVLESEFDVRILDEGVLKIFRLAQLAVEYQQFCRHYLDRSVYVLREEVTVLAKQLESMKNVVKERDEEIRKLRKRSKSAYRTSLPYGNDNIATMILKTLSNKSEIFPTLASSDTIQHNKCAYCDKVFLNQLYLQSHMSRRHTNMMDIPQKDNNQLERSSDENIKLSNEIIDLRSKLTDMEQLVISLKNTTTFETNVPKKIDSEPIVGSKEMKDAEVSTNSEGYILDKIEEWKKEEQDKNNKEINLLRTQIISMLDSFKEKEEETTAKKELSIMKELNETIKQQGIEILELKKELTNSLQKSSGNTEEIAKRKETEAQMSYWVKRAEHQSNEYKLLLQKLDVVAKEAEKSKVQAEVERMRVSQLENLLREKNGSSKNQVEDKQNMVETAAIEIKAMEPAEVKNKPNSKLIRDRMSIKLLQQKAQELLDIENTSTDSFASSDENVLKTEKNKSIKDEKKVDTNHKSNLIRQEYHNKRNTKKPLGVTNTREHKNGKLRKSIDFKGEKLQKNKNKVHLKEENLHSHKENGTIFPGSPVKIIRAKITEEVNNRLVELGVDPLKTRLPANIFSKQKLQLHEKQQMKFKKNPGSEQIFHTLLARLDSNATTMKSAQTSEHHNYSPKNKSFSISSVISNVKTKALSLVKSNDHNKNEHKSYDSVAKKAMMLLRTPSSSANSSPKSQTQDNLAAKSAELQNSNEKGNKVKSKIRSLSDHTHKTIKNYESDTESTITENIDHKYTAKQNGLVSATIEDLVKSPTRRPPDKTISNYTINIATKDVIDPTTSNTLLGGTSNDHLELTENNENSNDEVDSVLGREPRRAYSVENIAKLTKGVLKNASSTSSLNKKKVIFDMDAIQMKSVSASSPSQSITEKSDNVAKYGLGLVNVGNEEWDISSIENEPIPKNPVISRTSPKIAELRETIESQLIRRNNTRPSVVVGGVDLLSGPLLNKATVDGKGGSNTSLGSSILDDTDSTHVQNQIAFVKPRTFVEKDDSEIDISEFVTDDLIPKNTIKT